MKYTTPRFYSFDGQVKQGSCITGTSAPPICSSGSADEDSNDCMSGGGAGPRCTTGNQARHYCYTGNSDKTCCSTGNSAKSC